LLTWIPRCAACLNIVLSAKYISDKNLRMSIRVLISPNFIVMIITPLPFTLQLASMLRVSVISVPKSGFQTNTKQSAFLTYQSLVWLPTVTTVILPYWDVAVGRINLVGSIFVADSLLSTKSRSTFRITDVLFPSSIQHGFVRRSNLVYMVKIWDLISEPTN
jgi:hypothetical protein